MYISSCISDTLASILAKTYSRCLKQLQGKERGSAFKGREGEGGRGDREHCISQNMQGRPGPVGLASLAAKVGLGASKCWLPATSMSAHGGRDCLSRTVTPTRAITSPVRPPPSHAACRHDCAVDSCGSKTRCCTPYSRSSCCAPFTSVQVGVSVFRFHSAIHGGHFSTQLLQR